jgi:uncharacterized protein YfiM (DUF2279 family)
MKYALALVAVLIANPALADSWTGKDKTKHALAGAIIGAAITATTKDPLKGCAVATAAGAIKEMHDATASFKDFAVTAAFGCALAYSSGWVMTPREIRYTIHF